MHELAERLLEGSHPFTEVQEKEGVYFLKKAADRGFPQSQYLYGDALLRGLYGLQQDEGEGAEQILKSAEAGFALAQARIGAMSMEGYLRKIRKASDVGYRASAGSYIQVCICSFVCARRLYCYIQKCVRAIVRAGSSSCRVRACSSVRVCAEMLMYRFHISLSP